MLSSIPLSRLTPYAEKITGDHQCEFRRNWSTTNHIFCIHQILVFEEKLEYNEAMHQLFINLSKPVIQSGESSCIICSMNLVSS